MELVKTVIDQTKYSGFFSEDVTENQRFLIGIKDGDNITELLNEKVPDGKSWRIVTVMNIEETDMEVV